MASELVTYGSDRRMKLAVSEVIRAPVYGADWNVIRIGLRCSFIASATLTGTPRLAFGVCNGGVNGYGALSSDHVVGFRTSRSSFAYGATSTGRFQFIGNDNEMSFFKKIDTTVTQTVPSSSSSSGFLSSDSSVRSVLFLEITKGSPNFTFQIARPGNSTTGEYDYTLTEFQQMMEGGALSDVGSVVANTVARPLTPAALAVDEATDGDLDHIFVYWDRSSVPFTFDIAHRKVS